MKIRNILVSQPVPTELEKSPYGDLIKKYSVNIDFHKFFRIEGLTAREFRDAKIYINEYTAIIFNSKHAVDHFFQMAKEVRVEIPETMKYFCISDAIAFYLQKYVQFRKRKIFHAEQDTQQLLELIKKHKAEKFLIPCSDAGNKELSVALDAAKIVNKEAILYRTVLDDLKAHIDVNKYDMIVMFSPNGIRALFQSYPDFKQGEKLIATFGSTTAEAAIEAGLTVAITAPTKTAPSMTMALDQFLAKSNKR